MKRDLDIAVLARAIAGDAAAFRAVYEHCADPVFRFLCRMLGDEAAAEDATQETFLRVLGALPRFDPGGPARLTTWVLGIARRVALSRELSEERLRRRERTAGDAAPLATTADASSELRTALARAIAELPVPQRTVFVLRECHALAYDEIAALEEVDVGTVKSRLHRARVALQERLRDQLEPANGSTGGRRARA